jgi:hypothetical protein
VTGFISRSVPVHAYDLPKPALLEGMSHDEALPIVWNLVASLSEPTWLLRMFEIHRNLRAVGSGDYRSFRIVLDPELGTSEECVEKYVQAPEAWGHYYRERTVHKEPYDVVLWFTRKWCHWALDFVPVIPPIGMSLDPEEARRRALVFSTKMLRLERHLRELGDRGKPLVRKRKRSTAPGDARAKLVAALTKHHQYAGGSCLNLLPIGNNELARLAEVSESTASDFFTTEFKGHSKYKALCQDTGGLAMALKLLNGEFASHFLYGRRPIDEECSDSE